MLPHCFSNCSPHPIDRKLFKFEHFTSFGEFSSHFGIQLWINSSIHQYGNSRKNQRDMCIFCWNFSLVPSNAFIHQMDRWINFLELMKMFKNICRKMKINKQRENWHPDHCSFWMNLSNIHHFWDRLLLLLGFLISLLLQKFYIYSKIGPQIGIFSLCSVHFGTRNWKFNSLNFFITFRPAPTFWLNGCSSMGI